ncbi:peptide chain release factor aRF-1 [Natrinema longum]|uniref:peptide chain release factor aRF-1 n=1 Tax=Natrinema longum TaxID=370324 RepID=UPI001CCADE42|nr:peptide chain release factor aRF-1 [Natrinema longum]MBZ6497120.1 peptide chain release factor aRF-1 [Natrinema longum]
MQTTEYELRDRIDQLTNYRGEGTELITVAVPPDKSLHAVRERIDREYAQAANIKSDQTRTHVQDALGRIRRLLQAYEETPPSGLVIYAGVVDGELQDAVFDDLDVPVDVSLYRCAAEFETAPVEQALTPSEVYGLVILERGRAALGRLAGERIVSSRTFESQVMGKSRAGGQSAQRFERERDRQKHEFFEQVADAAEQTFLDEPTVDGVILGGTTITVDEFQQGNYLHHELRDHILGVYPIEYATKQGLSQLVERAEDVLSDAERRREREALDRFFTALGQGGDVAYGADGTQTALDYGAVDVLLVSDARPPAEIRDLEETTTDQGGECLVVSTDTDRGAQFDTAFGGLGALLRFRIN